MRAWQVQGAGEPAEVLHLVELEAPEPGPGEVRIRVTAAGLGLPDVFMCRGTYPLTPPLPFTSGQEATGTVTAVGEGVDLSLGDRIMCVTSFWGPRLVRRGVPGRGGRCVPRPRRAHRRRGGRVLDPAPHRLDRPRRPRSASPRATGWPCSARPAAAGSPRSSSATRSAPAWSRSSATTNAPRSAASSGPTRRSTTATARSRPRSASSPAAGASTCSTTPSGRARRGRRRRAGPLRAPARGRLRQRRWPRDHGPRPRHHEHVAGRRVRGRVLPRRARRHPRAPRRPSSRDGRLRNAVTAEVPFAELPAGAPTHGRPRCGRQARDGAVTIPSLDATGKVVVVTGGSKGLGPRDGARVRGGGRRRRRRQPQARAVRGGRRRGARPRVAGRCR